MSRGALQGAQAAGDASLVGWRISEHVGALSASLQKTETQVVAGADCGDSLCSGANTRCQGDIGAPLVQVSHHQAMAMFIRFYDRQ